MKNLLTLLICVVAVTFAQVPKFEFSENIKCGGQAINDVSFPTMFVTDWDGDGLKDLIVGEFSPNGKVRLYKNVNTNKAPEFDSYTYMQANGSDIKLSSG